MLLAKELGATTASEAGRLCCACGLGCDLRSKIRRIMLRVAQAHAPQLPGRVTVSLEDVGLRA